MKKKFITGLFLLAFPLIGFAAVGEYNPQSVGAGNPELHIKADGTISLQSGRVDQIAGSTFYLGLKWGALPMRFTMKTDARTIVIKRYGGSTTVSQIKVGDYLDAEGEFFVGSDFFGMDALRVKDWSLQEESGTFSGVIMEVNSDERLVLRTLQNQTISVRFATSSAVSIKKGAVTIPFGRLRKGDAALLISGVYDYSKNLLTADRIIVYQNKADFTARNFEGTLKQIISADIPATLIVSVNGVEHTVKLSDKTAVLKKNRSAAELPRFVVGDTVRFYGAVREEEKTLNDVLVVDAEIIRNLNL
ncbi:MAG TPA: hypothetical protein DEF00_01320 [Candidatus Taylorbacteria bacterium]|nr:MAG: hypothetical protein UY03_C0014G0039 [Parcubacteria group bacterium GW2011_GWA2_47_64]KKU97035.1 MAG: hypothetical protein UY29_C0003G0032 [Parcubacteria group bacterium GW2011_GWC2_48_17]HBV01018.1 hypothetical protein [Candidatus Taylorbacteria bacterium]